MRDTRQEKEPLSNGAVWAVRSPFTYSGGFYGDLFESMRIRGISIRGMNDSILYVLWSPIVSPRNPPTIEARTDVRKLKDMSMEEAVPLMSGTSSCADA